MKLPRTIGLAVGRQHRCGAGVDQRSGCSRSDREPVDADVSLVKPLPCTEQFWKRGHAVPSPLWATTHGRCY